MIRLAIPFISISAKKETVKGKACIRNQYLPVSKSQIRIDVNRIISTSRGERREPRSLEKTVGNALYRRTEAGGNEMADQPGDRPCRDRGEHRREDENDQRAEEQDRAIDRQLRDRAGDRGTAAGEPRQLGKVDEDKQHHHHGIEGAFNEYDRE